LGTVLFVTVRTIRYDAVDADLRGRVGFVRSLWSEIREHRFRKPPDRPLKIEIDGDAKLERHIALELKTAHPMIFSVRGRDLVDPPGRPLDPDGLFDAASGKQVLSSVEIDGLRVRVLSIPMLNGRSVVAVAQVAAPLDDLDDETAALGRSLLLMLPLAILVTSVIGAWLTTTMMRPIRVLTSAAEQIEPTNLATRLPVNGHDEFEGLALTFNGMLERLDHSFQRLDSAFEAQRRFTADVSHELKSPLTAIKARVGVAMGDSLIGDTTREHFAAIGAVADNMSSIVQDLLLLALSDEGRLNLQMAQVPLLSCVLEAFDLVKGLEERVIDVRVPARLTMWADYGLLRRMLVNLLDNAAKHTSSGQTIRIEARRRRHFLSIRVVDSGEGIAPENLPFVFERMVRFDTSLSRQAAGAGLGLAIVKSIVDAHKGTVAIESQLGTGTSVTVTLPREAPSSILGDS
jgi:signal transduction histidine kinase